MAFWRFRQCVMYSTAACASCTVTDVKVNLKFQSGRGRIIGNCHFYIVLMGHFCLQGRAHTVPTL